MVLASGTRVEVEILRERVRGTTPAAVATPVVNLTITDLAAAGQATIARSAGSYIDDGFTPGQVVQTLLFTVNAVNNAFYRVITVDTALQITVQEFGTADAVVTEVDTDATIQIVFQKIRATSRNINPEKDTLESEEVRTDRQKSDVRHGFNRVVGSLGFELSRGAFDDTIEAASSDLWKNILMAGASNLAVTATATTVTITRATGNWINDGFRIGHFVVGTGFSASNNNATPIRLTNITATVLTAVNPTLNAWVTEADAAGKTVDEVGSRLDIGTVLQGHTIQRVFGDVVQYQISRGSALDQLQVNIQPASIVGGTLNILGMSFPAMQATSLSGVASRASPQNSPYSAFDGEVYEGGASIAVVTGITFTLANNRALEPVVGSPTSPDVFEGDAVINGTLTAFFEDEVLFNKFANETESTIWVSMTDPSDATEFMNIVLPRVKYTGAPMDPGQRGPVTLDMPFQGLVKTDLVGAGSTTVASSLTFQRSNSTPL